MHNAEVSTPTPTQFPNQFQGVDDEGCWRAVETRDPRFDGWFITGVLSTGIYCRPSCPTPVQPKRKNVQFFRHAAAAQRAGLRACKRCRPDASPGSPEWNLRADLVGRAMRLIRDGVVDRHGVAGLARQLAVSERHLNRVIQAELGASPVALARAQRAQAARVLIETTALPFADVAFAAGFSSIRQFNDTVRSVFALTPSQLRSSRAPADDPAAAAVGLRLTVRQPFDAAGIIGWLASHAPAATTVIVPNGKDDRNAPTVRLSLRLPHGLGAVSITAADTHLWASFELDDFADLAAAVSRVRRGLDLDADPESVNQVIGQTALAPLVAQNPGQRVPGTLDGFSQAVSLIVFQQVSLAAGRTFLQRLVEHAGTPIDRFGPELTHVFPDAPAILDADLTSMGLTTRRHSCLRALSAAYANGELDLQPGADRQATRAALLALPGIGPWTADIIAMRALGDPDMFPTGDLVLRRRAAEFGLSNDQATLRTEAAAWMPWRSYAAHHLWTHHGNLGASTAPKSPTAPPTETASP